VLAYILIMIVFSRVKQAALLLFLVLLGKCTWWILKLFECLAILHIDSLNISFIFDYEIANCWWSSFFILLFIYISCRMWSIWSCKLFI